MSITTPALDNCISQNTTITKTATETPRRFDEKKKTGWKAGRLADCSLLKKGRSSTKQCSMWPFCAFNLNNVHPNVANIQACAAGLTFTLQKRELAAN